MRFLLTKFLFILLSTFSLRASVENEHYSFAKLKGKSWLLGKDRFLQYYLIEPGDQFTPEKHAHSLNRVREALKNEGYLASTVTDSVMYDKKNKTVSVTLAIDAGTQYTIDSIALTLKDKHDSTLESDLSDHLNALIGVKFEKNSLDKAAARIKELLLKRGYAHPQITLTTSKDDKRSSVALTITVLVGKKKEYLFEGNRFFTVEQLLEHLFALDDQDISVPIEVLAEDIEQLYKSKGFFRVIVDWQESPESVQFSIYEGKRALIETTAQFLKNGPPIPKRDHVLLQLRLAQGEESFLNESVKEVLLKFLSLLQNMGFYDEERIIYLKNRAEEKLIKLGYWNASFAVALDEPLYKSTEDLLPAFTITVRGLEKRSLIKTISIKDYPELLAAEPFARWLNLSEPQPISPTLLDEQRRWLLNHFKELGYLNASADFSIIKTENGDKLEWTVDVKQPVLFGPTRIIGLQKMKPYIVTRELAYQEGEIFNRLKIEQTVQRLKDLCMFESISVMPETISDSPSMPLVIRLKEDDPYEVRTRFGFQIVSKNFTHLSWTTYKVGGSFIWKNPAGLADKFILDADLTRYTRDIIASYELPWIGSLPVRTTFKLYSTRFDQPLISSNRFLYKEAHDGFSTTFHNKHYGWLSDVRLGFEFNKLSNISRRLAQEIQFEPTLIDRRIAYIYCEPTVTFEHFDNKADPCRGFYTFLGFKAMIPPTIRDGWFVRVLLEQSLFYPLYRSLIGAVRWRLGHIFNAQFSTILPTERFYLGGASSLRGYETNMAPPLNDVVCDDCRFWVPVGGKTMVNINTELRFPLYRWFSGVVFTDMGVLTQDRFADIAANKWLGATGFGFRAATPLGPIRFDIGWKWHKRRPDDRRYAWFLTFGHAF